MSFTELLILMVIGVILFGPEDLPDVARAVGRVVFEIKKITGEMTRELQDAVNTPSTVLQKAFDETVNKPSIKPEETENSEKNTNSVDSEEGDGPPSDVKEQEELLSYEEEDPLADLPQEMVSYEKKGASR